MTGLTEVVGVDSVLVKRDEQVVTSLPHLLYRLRGRTG